MIEAMRIAAVLNLESDMAAVLQKIAAELRTTTKLMETAAKVARGLMEAMDKAPSSAGFQKVDESVLKTEGLFEELTKKVNDYRAAVNEMPKPPSAGGAGGPRSTTGPQVVNPIFGAGDDYANAMWENTSRDLAYRQQRALAEHENAAREVWGFHFGSGRALEIAFVGQMVVQGVGALLDMSRGYNDEASRLQQRGVSRESLEAAYGTIFSTTQAVPGRTLSETTKDLGTIRSVIGESAGADSLEMAKKLLPHFEVVAAALAAGTGDTNENAMHMLFRAVEMMGGGINPKTGKIDPERLLASLDAAEKALEVVSPIGKANDFFQMMKQGSMVAKTMDPQAFFAMILAPLLDQGGSRTGTALQALGRQFFGGIMTGKVANELLRLHIFNEGDFERQRSGVKVTDQGFKHFEEEMKGGFFEFFNKIVRPAMVAAGITTEEEQTRELYKILSTDTGRRLGSLFMTQADQVRKEQGLYTETPSPDQQLRIARDTNIAFNEQSMFAAAENFFQVLGKENSGSIIAALHAATAFFNFISRMADAKLPEPPAGGLLQPQSYGPFSYFHTFDWLYKHTFGHPDNDKSTPLAPTGTDGSLIQKQSYQTGNNAPQTTIVKVYLDGKEMAGALIKKVVQMADSPISGNPSFDGRRLYQA